MPPPTPLVLVSAGYEVGGLTLELTFDRAIDVAGIVAATMVVRDGVFEFTYEGAGVMDQPTPQSVRVNLSGVADFFGEGVHLDSASGNGIVAVDDGGTWDGAADLPLPWP